MQIIQSRRKFLAGAVSTGAAGLLGPPTVLHAEPSPETTTVRLPKTFRALCEAPKNIATELLRAEGFKEVVFVDPPSTPTIFNC